MGVWELVAFDMSLPMQHSRGCLVQNGGNIFLPALYLTICPPFFLLRSCLLDGFCLRSLLQDLVLHVRCGVLLFSWLRPSAPMVPASLSGPPLWRRRSLSTPRSRTNG